MFLQHQETQLGRSSCSMYLRQGLTHGIPYSPLDTPKSHLLHDAYAHSPTVTHPQHIGLGVLAHITNTHPSQSQPLAPNVPNEGKMRHLSVIFRAQKGRRVLL